MGRAVCLWAAEVNFFKGFKLSKGGLIWFPQPGTWNALTNGHHLEVNNNYE
jgi:hypothetical protein